MLQYRVAPEGGVRDIDEKKRQVLVTYPWEIIDSYLSDFSRSCFDEELSNRLPSSCWQHIRSEPIGHAVDWQKTTRANDFVVQLSNFDAVPRARQAFVQIQDGDISDWSFGFDKATSEPHPSGERGHIRFTKGRMAEISPVTVGSIPGAGALGVRAEADRAAVAELVREKVISPEEGRRMLELADQIPTIEPAPAVEAHATEPARERIIVGAGVRSEPEPAQEQPAAVNPVLAVSVVGTDNSATVEFAEGARSVTLVINDDGTVSAAGYSMDGAQADGDNTADAADPDADAGQLASAIDAALDAYAGLMDGVDTTELPAQVQQALALADAAGVAADELLDAMGLPDPDEDGDRAAAKGDPVTVGKKSGKVKRVMPNGALLVDWGDGKSSIVSASDAEEQDGASERAAKGHAPEHLGFKKLKDVLAAKGAADPGALAAYIGRKKYGDAGMAAKSAAGRVKAKARSAATTELTDEQALAELQRIGLTLESPDLVAAVEADAAELDAAANETAETTEGEPAAERSDDLITETRAVLDLLATR